MATASKLKTFRKAYMRTKTRRTIQILCLIAIILSFILFLKAAHDQWPLSKMGRDFTAYWASTHLLISGQNPYQSDKIFDLEKSVGWTDKKPSVMYNPPYVLTYIIPFASDNYPLAKILWLFFIFGCLLICTIWIWQFYGGTNNGLLLFLLVLFTYTPLYYCLVRGQIVPLILLGIAGFLHFESQKKWFLAGLFVCLIGIKPHATYLFITALLFWTIYKKRWGILIGAGCASLFITAIPLLYNPNVFIQFYTDVLTQSFQYFWETPTAGTLLRDYFGEDKSFLQDLPMIIGISWFLYHWYRNYSNWSWTEQTPLLIFVSLMTTFYAWINDYLLLIIAIIQASIWLINEPLRLHSKFMIFLYALINLMTWVTAFSGGSEQKFVWVVPALFINYLLIRNFYVKEKGVLLNNVRII